MFRIFLLSLAAGAALSAGASAAAQPPAQAPAEAPAKPPAQAPAPAQPPQRLTASMMVDGLRPHLPREFDGGATLRAARAEGDLVIFTVEVPPHWLSAGVAVFTQGFTDGMCRAPENPFFDNGISIRIDTVTGRGEPTTGQVISRCPGR
jgi:glucose/arabinose dehydrogenase